MWRFSRFIEIMRTEPLFWSVSHSLPLAMPFLLGHLKMFVAVDVHCRGKSFRFILMYAQPLSHDSLGFQFFNYSPKRDRG